MSKIVDAMKHEQSVKVSHCGTMRRFSVSSYEVLRQRLQKLLGVKDAALVINYVDEEGDAVRLSSPEDFEEALKSCGQLLRIKIDAPESNEPRSPTAAAVLDEGAQLGWEGGHFSGKGWLWWTEGPSHGKGGFEHPCKGKGKGWDWHADEFAKGKGKGWDWGWHPHDFVKGKGKGCHTEDCDYWVDSDTMAFHNDEEKVRDIDECGKGRGWWGKGKGKGHGAMPWGFSEDCADVAKRLEAAAGKPLPMRRMMRIMKQADWKVAAAEDALRKRCEKREAKRALKKDTEACLDGTATLSEVFPDMPLRKVKWALAKAGGDVDVAASQLSEWSGLLKRKREAKEEMMLKAKDLAQRLHEAGNPRGPWRIWQLLKMTGGDVEAAVKTVESNVELRRSKGKGARGKGKGWQQWGAPAAAANDTSSSSSDSDSEV